MTDQWVINASPVILLAKANIIHLLPKLCRQLVVPAGVVEEVSVGNLSDAGRLWLAEDGHRFVRSVPDLHAELREWRGGLGEAQVVTWALLNAGFTAVLDDGAARRRASHLGVPVIGSLRVIVRAKQLGFLPQARPALEKLRGAGAYVTDELIDDAITLAGEGP